jgi:integrase
MRKTSTKLSRVRVNGRRRLYCVTWPKIGAGRNRQFFKEKADAETFLQAKLIEQENFGRSGLSLGDRERAEYLECCELLSPYAATIRDAVTFYLPHLKATNRTCTAAELVGELLKVKRADGASERYLSDLKSRLGQFAATFDGKPVAEITGTEVDGWLRSLADSNGKPLAAVGRNNFRRVLIVAFNYAVSRGYCVTNPARNTAEAKETKLAAGVLTVRQAAGLLTHCHARILPGVALGLFAGIRPESEGLHLDWSHIDFEDRTINVEPDKTKADSSARYVEMSDNLIAWLSPFRQLRGAIFPPLTEYYDRLREARKSAAITEWPHDALRHSFGSYHYGLHRNAALTQAQMGHSNAKIFFKHYRKPMKQSAAESYWRIMPDPAEAAKVVEFNAA